MHLTLTSFPGKHIFMVTTCSWKVVRNSLCRGMDLMFCNAEQMQIHVNTDISTSHRHMFRQKVYNLTHRAFKIQLEEQINYVTEILSALINVKYSSFKGRDRKAFFFKAQASRSYGTLWQACYLLFLHGDRLKGNTKLYWTYFGFPPP